MPGGSPLTIGDPEETLLAAANRETYEETNLSNLKYRINRYAGQTEWYINYSFKPIDNKIELWITTFFVSICDDPSPLLTKEPHKHYDWKWFPIEDVLPIAKDPYLPMQLLRAIRFII